MWSVVHHCIKQKLIKIDFWLQKKQEKTQKPHQNVEATVPSNTLAKQFYV